MKLSGRLQACADFVIRGNTVADIGADHGYLSIYLYKEKISPKVFAADLREKPLESAKRNAQRYGIQDGISFFLSDGLDTLPVSEIQTVICAGMGGDSIAEILKKCPEIWSQDRQFILEPQTGAPELRAFLLKNGFVIRREAFAQDGKFVYSVMDVAYTGPSYVFRDGEEFCPHGNLNRADPLYRNYMERVRGVLLETLENLHRGRDVNPEKLIHFQNACNFVEQEMKLW